LRLSVQSPGTLRLQVRRGGEPVAGAHVKATLRGFSVGTATTDAQGASELAVPLGTIVVEVQKGAETTTRMLKIGGDETAILSIGPAHR